MTKSMTRISGLFSKMGRRRLRPLAGLAVVAITSMLLSGCVPAGSSDGSAPGDTNLYMGLIPAPAPMPVSPHLPAYPRSTTSTDAASTNAYNAALNAYSTAFQAAQAKVTAQAAAIKKLAANTKKGGETAVAAWESLLVTAGIAVQGANGKPVSLHGDTGSGWPTTDAELRLVSALAASPGGLSLENFASALAPTLFTTKAALTQDLYTELYSITDRDFAAVFNAFGSVTFAGTKQILAPDVFLNWAQVELLTRRLAVEFEVASLTLPGPATSSYRFDATTGLTTAPAGYLASRTESVPCKPSESDPWADALVTQTQKGITKTHDLIIEHFEEVTAEKVVGSPWIGDAKLVTTSHLLALARVLLSWASLIAKALSLEASFDLPNAPLVRTKDTQPGEVRDLTITYTFNAGKWEKIRPCLNLLLGFVGIELPGTSPEPPSKMDVQLKSADPSILRIGDGTGKDKKVDTDLTDGDGKASFKLSGAPQGDRIPEQATPKDLNVKVSADNDLKTSDFWSDVSSVPWDVVDAKGALGINLLPELIARSKFITFRYTVPVRDWKLSADFEVTAVGEVTEQLAYNEQWAGCGPTTNHDESIKGIGTFASDPVKITAKLISNTKGNIGDQAFVFVPQGKNFTMFDAGEGDGVYMFQLPASYKTEKTFSEPGTWKKPSLYVHHETDCVGGGGLTGSTPVPDCGVRDYKAPLVATMPKARHLYLAGGQANESNLWKSCGSRLYPTEPPVAPTISDCKSPKMTGGKVPSIADIFDASKKHLDVSGTMTCTSEGQGSIQQIDYNWSMQFCRIENGKPDC